MSGQILMSGPMASACWRGDKSVTRRIIKPQPGPSVTSAGCYSDSVNGPTGKWSWLSGDPRDSDTWGHEGDFALKWRPGDKLVVRETCRAEELSRPDVRRPATRHERQLLKRTEIIEADELDGMDGVRYSADGLWRSIEKSTEEADRWSALHHYGGGVRTGDQPSRIGRWVPAIHMPAWAGRMTLLVTEVRVERLHDINEADAIAEGIEARGVGPLWGWIDYLETNPKVTRHFSDPRRSYQSLWESINGPGSWGDNPWVASIYFEVQRKAFDHTERS